MTPSASCGIAYSFGIPRNADAPQRTAAVGVRPSSVAKRAPKDAASPSR